MAQSEDAATPAPEPKRYVIAVNGSPRREGNTERMLYRVLEPLSEKGWETDYYQVGGKAMRGCQACMGCRKTGNCIIDDAFQEVYPKLLRASAIVVGSPTYVSDVTAETKAFIDRAVFVALANNFALKGKVGAAVAVHRRAGAVNVFDTINHMFLISQMVVPGSFYWNMGVGTDKGEVENDAEGMATMRRLGEVINHVATALQRHAAPWPEPRPFR
ncbi:MAG: flavodoxin family protein [Planctomycetes bacterium]|nr:flavodoxin family protein [Planctomycetota bacterium]